MQVIDKGVHIQKNLSKSDMDGMQILKLNKRKNLNEHIMNVKQNM